MFSDEIDRVASSTKAKTAIKSTKATLITISYKHTMLIYEEKYKFNVYIAKESGNGPDESTQCGKNAAADENLRQTVGINNPRNL